MAGQTRFSRLKKTAIAIGVLIGATIVWVFVQYRRDISIERKRVSADSIIARTPCGAIEYSIVGNGTPVLIVHGAGGGFDQALEFARDLSGRSIKVIAMSRFGYLRTPLPDDASASAQADAHLCLMDALGIERAAIVGASAGAPSAMQFAIRHPDRTAGLLLLVPAAYHPAASPSGDPITTPPWTAFLFDTALKSDFLFWLAIHIGPDTVMASILATPPEVVRNADSAEQQRVRRFMMRILPVSPRRLGLLNDAKITSTLPRYELERIQAPTLIISVKDDRFGTYAGARYSAEHIPGARFVGYDQGGHMWVGHNQQILEEAARFFQEVFE